MDKYNLEGLRHTASHLLAAAVLELYPATLNTIGPVIENGFYYDFEFRQPVSEKDLPKIEQKMRQLLKEWNSMEKRTVTKKEAQEFYRQNPYKLELIQDLIDDSEKITFYKSGSFTDLCRGGHLAEPRKELKYFKLLGVAGAYWRGDERNKMLTRIYGTAFFSKKELENYLWQMEEARKRDHRKLGKKLGLFVIDETIGKGLPMLAPKGAIIRQEIEKYEAELEAQAGFERVYTPHIARSELYKKTGHWQHYRETMYQPFGIDNQEYVLKPMNCPHHYAIYASVPRSYKDLPVRLTEPGTCYRYEKSGEVSGLLRVRALTIDDSHILMREDQVEVEFKLCIDMVAQMFKAFSLKDYYVRVSLADPTDAIKYIADAATWKKAGDKLLKIVKDNHLKYVITKGEASFYGPKLDYMVKDSLGREWQMSTLQLDLFMAKRLNLIYTDEQGKPQHPVILHRGLTGSLERTLGILIEHFAGAFPLWLSPVQVAVLPLSENFLAMAQKVQLQLHQAGFRVVLAAENKPLGARIREQSLQKTPYLCIIGERELRESHKREYVVSVRTRDNQELGNQPLPEFINTLKRRIEKKI